MDYLPEFGCGMMSGLRSSVSEERSPLGLEPGGLAGGTSGLDRRGSSSREHCNLSTAATRQATTNSELTTPTTTVITGVSRNPFLGRSPPVNIYKRYEKTKRKGGLPFKNS